MTRIARILCPVDLSEFSRRALHHAAALGRWYEAELTVLSVRPTILQPAAWMYAPLSMPLETTGDRARPRGKCSRSSATTSASTAYASS